MIKDINIDDSLVLREMNFWNIPGLSISAIKKGERVHTGTFGFRDKENSLSVTESTLFGIASCSKAMTSAIVAMLVDDNKLEYDTPVVEYVPDFKLMDDEATTKTTLRDMLCHRTGLGGHDAIWPTQKSLRDFSKTLGFLKPNAPFRYKAQYSNIIYAAIGHIVETATNMSWSDIMQRYLFEPLKMTETNSQAESMTGSENFANPYQMFEGALRKLSVWNVDVVAPAASVNSTAVDMGKWLEFLVNKGKDGEGKALISEKTFDAMISKQLDYEDNIAQNPEIYPADGYAMGWQTGIYRGRKICKHTGKIQGYSSMQTFLPDEDIGISIMMNLHSPTVALMHTITYTLIDSMLKLLPVDWIHKLRDDQKPTSDTYKDCDINVFSSIYPDAIINITVPKKLEAQYRAKSYEGTYRNEGYGDVKISIRSGVLHMEYRDMMLPLMPYWGGVFRVDNVKVDTLNMKIPLSFICNEKQQCIGVKIRFEPLIDDIFFQKI